jgi:hypothetical protein
MAFNSGENLATVVLLNNEKKNLEVKLKRMQYNYTLSRLGTVAATFGMFATLYLHR